ncbi:Uncharacterized protein F1880_005608 [Penicillium rolfsii]|nr:Uncharacterized protein F1880_005608 [Penicillium rolfsii]
MADPYPSTHPAVAITAKRAPLSILEVPTEAPEIGEAVVQVQWTASSPADLHQADGNLVTEYPFILGCSFAGTIVATGPDYSNDVTPDSKFEVGDRVCGFAMPQQKQQGFQTYVTVPCHMMGHIPENLSMEAAVTVPVNLVTAFHAITKSLGFDLPWPIPSNYTPQEANKPILVWGGAGSVGSYAVQVLHRWGYRNVLVTASKKHHEEIRRLGATKIFDYSENNVTDQILADAGQISYVLDCVGHVDGTLRPISKIADRGTKVAVVVPIIARHSTVEIEPELIMNPSTALVGEWKEGVELVPIMTFFYEENEFFKWHLQPDVIPALLRAGDIEPNKQRIVEGDTLLGRAQQALDLLRERAPSGERLVWRVSNS